MMVGDSQPDHIHFPSRLVSDARHQLSVDEMNVGLFRRHFATSRDSTMTKLVDAVKRVEECGGGLQIQTWCLSVRHGNTGPTGTPNPLPFNGPAGRSTHHNTQPTNGVNQLRNLPLAVVVR